MDLLAALTSLVADGNEEVDYQGFSMRLVNKDHPLSEVLPETRCIFPVIVVSKHCYEQIVEVIESPTVKEDPNESNVTSASYDGSPLKMEKFTSVGMSDKVITTSTGKLVVPLTADEARSILSKFHSICETLLKEKTDVPPLWILCDAKDNEHLACLGTQLLPAGQEEVQGDAIVDTVVTSLGHLRKAELPKSSYLINDHLWRTAKKNYDCDCRAQYNLLDPGTLNLSDNEIQGSLQIIVEWKDMANLMAFPPANAIANASVSVVAGSERSHAYGCFQELTILKGIANGLRNDAVEWSRNDSTHSALERVKSFVTEYKEWSGQTLIESKDTNEKDEDKLFQNFSGQDRKDLDFTEQLWNILKYCGSLYELVESLRFVFKALQKGDIQPMVHRNSKNKLAEIIRLSFFKKISIPNLLDKEPFELLVEMGMEKLVRDYVYTLTGKELVTVGHLSSFIEPRGSLLERLDRLERLHYVLELVAVLEQYSTLPTSVLSHAASHALMYYEQNAAEDWHTFTIPIPRSNMLGVTEGWLVKEWRAELSSNVFGKKIRSCHIVTNSSAVPHLNLGAEFADEDPALTTDLRQEKKTEPRYFFTTLTESVCKL